MGWSSESGEPVTVNPRGVVVERLKRDLGEATERDIKAAVLCGEMGCEDMREFILNHPVLRCPYGALPDGRDRCRTLREEYREAISATQGLHETKELSEGERTGR